MQSENNQKLNKARQLLSKLCCCHEIYEIEVIPISTTYFKRYDPRNISIRKSVRKSIKKFDERQKTGMAKFVKPKPTENTEKTAENIEKLREQEIKQIKQKEDEEAERVMKSILDGKRPGTLKYKIDRSQSQPVLRVKNYFIYDLWKLTINFAYNSTHLR